MFYDLFKYLLLICVPVAIGSLNCNLVKVKAADHAIDLRTELSI